MSDDIRKCKYTIQTKVHKRTRYNFIYQIKIKQQQKIFFFAADLMMIIFQHPKKLINLVRSHIFSVCC